MEDKKFYLKAPEELGGLYFAEASDGVNEYTTIVHLETIGNYSGEFSNTKIKKLVAEYPVLKTFMKVEVPQYVERQFTAVVDDTSIFEDDLFAEKMYVVHNRDKDTWSIVPDSGKDKHGWNYVLNEEEEKYLNNFDLTYSLTVEEELTVKENNNV